MERTEPTVFSGAADGPLDGATLAAQDSLGYSVVPDLLSAPEVQAYWAELQKLAGGAQQRRDERAVVEIASAEVRTIFAAHQLSELIAELATDPRVLDAAVQLLGSEVYLHQTRVNYQPGFTDAGFYWHSDFETWHAEDGMPAPRAVSCSIALTESYAFNGGPLIMPGSHRTFVPCAAPAEQQPRQVRADSLGVPGRDALTKLAAEHGIDQFTGSAGTAVWFDANVMHGASNNITPYPRSDIFLVFNSVQNTLAEPFAGTPRRPEFVASRTYTPLRR